MRNIALYSIYIITLQKRFKKIAQVFKLNSFHLHDLSMKSNTAQNISENV